MNSYIDKLNWRYATKKFDITKKVSEPNLQLLLEAARLSASSYGLQPYKIYVLSDKDIREKLKEASWGQTQLIDASHIIVLANRINFGEELVDNYLENVSITRKLSPEAIHSYGDFMKSKLGTLSEEEKNTWTAKQTYIALGNLLSAAADLKIDTCPMEGFNKESYNEILGLNELNLNASVVLAIGYRSKDDESQYFKKVRKSKKELFTHI